ncbi:MAG: hypothetical protein V1695_00245 [Candidatus Uhrbacteria bacterium]
MKTFFSNLKYTSFTIVFLVLFVLNFYHWQNVVLGTVLLGLFLLYYGAALGRVITYKETWLHRVWSGGLLLLSVFMLLGTALYYVGSIIPDFWVLCVLLTPAVVYLVSKKHYQEEDTLNDFKHTIPNFSIAAVILALLCLVIAFSVLGEVSILDAVRSPWERIPTIIFLPVFGLSVLLITLGIRGRERAWLFPLIMAGLFLFVSLATFAYPLGYGFDTFIHRATVEHIATEGTITPKPFYYIGQYVATLFIHQGFQLPLDLVDRLLLPLLTALLLPLAWYFGFYYLGENRRAAMFSVLGVFLIPLGGFIVTTPQGMANLWTVLIILLSIPLLKNQQGISLTALFLLGLTALAIHPLAGIPIMLYLALIATGSEFLPSHFTWRLTFRPGVNPVRKIVSRFIFGLTVISGSLILPLAFLISSKLSGLSLSFNWSSLLPSRLAESLNIEVFFSNRFDTILDFVYLYGFNMTLILILLSAITILVFRRKLSSNLYLPLIMVGMLAINYLVLKTVVDFTFLIDYERSNYADRLIPLAGFFLIPYLGLFLLWLWQKLLHKPVAIRAFVICLMAAIITSAFYLAYPCKDNYQTSHGFNVSQSDMKAVYLIDEMGDEDKYLVLANQSVSAAAIWSFGFKQYYDNMFYYPIPTGGELYNYFLTMNDTPDRDTAESTISLISADKLFYVVNDYWWEAPRIIETAKRTADSWVSIDAGKIYIFEYLNQ